MRRTFLISAMALGLLAAPIEAQAQQRVVHGVVGAGAGAIVGGPVGAVVGGAVGYAAGPEITRGARVGYNNGRRRYVQHRHYRERHANEPRRQYDR